MNQIDIDNKIKFAQIDWDDIVGGYFAAPGLRARCAYYLLWQAYHGRGVMLDEPDKGDKT